MLPHLHGQHPRKMPQIRLQCHYKFSLPLTLSAARASIFSNTLSLSSNLSVVLPSCKPPGQHAHPTEPHRPLHQTLSGRLKRFKLPEAPSRTSALQPTMVTFAHTPIPSSAIPATQLSSSNTFPIHALLPHPEHALLLHKRWHDLTLKWRKS